MMSAARAASLAADRKPATRRPAQARYDLEGDYKETLTLGGESA